MLRAYCEGKKIVDTLQRKHLPPSQLDFDTFYAFFCFVA